MANDRSRAPKVDARSTDDIVGQTEALITTLTGGAWQPVAPAQGLDPLGALVRVFADMAGQLLDGINAVPDASFAAFLRLIGVEAQRPAPARAALTFRLVEGAPVDAVVPAGTKVGATAAEGDSNPEPIVFETEAELVVTRAQLLGVWAHAPDRDRLDSLERESAGLLAAFHPTTPGVHELWISAPLLARSGAETWTLGLDLTNAAPDLELRWFGDRGAGLEPLVTVAKWEGTRLLVRFDRPPALVTSTVAGREHTWLCARLVATDSPPPRLLRRVDLAAKFSSDGLVPKKVVRGATQLDTLTDFYPFDATPLTGATFAIDGGDALAQPAGASVALTITLAGAVDSDATRPRGSSDLRVLWELLDASGTWHELGRSSGTDPAILTDPGNPHGFVDDTYALTRAGRLRFRLPFTVTPVNTGGKSGRWLRARIVQGNFGAGTSLRPPMIGSLRLGYSHVLAPGPVALCVAQDLGHQRSLGPLASDGPAVPVFTPRPPGVPELGDRPALYLGFDRAFEPRPVQLYVAVVPPDPTQIAPPEQLPPVGDAPRLEWEYLGARGWTRLGVRDGTHALHQRGILSFVGPTDLTRARLFAGDGYWVRARWVAGSFRAPPRIARVGLNTVWARHAATRRGEVLGSGTGAPDQRFKLVATPVLAGERIEVRERDTLGERELATLREELGDDGVTIERDATGALKALWIRWTPVTHFHGSGPADRHYVLDAATGELRFGDGLAGRAPPQGRANVRAAVYATGGGPRGNRPADAVSELKSAIAYVAGVTNVEPASGGSDREDDARVRARGPRRLRHRDRAVTAADLADLAFEAAPEVARAHVLTAPFNPIDVAVDLGAADAGVRDARGWVTDEAVPADTSAASQRSAEVRVVIVPHGDVDQPAPSIGLLEQVEAHLLGRAPPAMRLHVSGPRWIRVTVRAEVVTTATAAADRTVSELRAAITRFIHPLTGGELEQGWDFGRIPRRSHFYRLLARFPGVHHITRLDVITDPPLPAASEPLTLAQRAALAGALVYSGAHELILVASAEDP